MWNESNIRRIKNLLPINLIEFYYKLQHKETKNKKIRYFKNLKQTMYFHQKNQCVFIHIPKTAGTSVAQSLFGCYPQNHFTTKEFKILYKSEFDFFFKFTFVRNPWDRFFSAYNYYLEKKNFINNDLYLKNYNYDEFNSFVIKTLNTKIIWSSFLFYPQTFWLNNNIQNLNFVGRFENINDDFNFICEKLGKKTILPKLNIANKKLNYKDFYSKKSIKVIKRLYECDIKLLNYEY